MMQKQVITDNPHTICWHGDSIIDWASGGNKYLSNGKILQLGKYSFGYKFDCAISSADNEYTFVYERLGTKGLLLKNGELVKEINRSYYCADVYEYPAAFLTYNRTTYLIHCPIDYCRLDFEDVESGELITDIPGRNPQDIFHSRLELNSSNTYLLSKGWVWHPVNIVEAYNIEDCIKNPLLLDKITFGPDLDVEICTASFLNDHNVLIGSSDEIINADACNLPIKHIAIWDLISNKISNPVKIDVEFGNLFAINENFAWDTFGNPKIINIKTGGIIDIERSINSGDQQSSIINNNIDSPSIIFNPANKKLAIKGKNQIVILTPPDYVFNI